MSSYTEKLNKLEEEIKKYPIYKEPNLIKEFLFRLRYAMEDVEKQVNKLENLLGDTPIVYELNESTSKVDILLRLFFEGLDEQWVDY